MKKQKTFRVWGKIITDEFINFKEFNKYPEHLTEFEIDEFTLKILIGNLIKNKERKKNVKRK